MVCDSTMKKINKVLLIDDDEICNELNLLTIKKSNFSENIDIVYNGEEALEYFFKKKYNDEFPDIIFLDINMPRMDGFEFLDKVKENTTLALHNARIYLLTSSINQSDISKAKNYAIDGFLNKPLTKNKLQELFK